MRDDILFLFTPISFFISLVSVIFLFICILKEKKGQLSLTAMAVFFALCANIDKLSSFKISGTSVDAEMRQTIGQAQDYIKAIRELVRVSMPPIISSMALANMFGPGGNPSERDREIEAIKTELKNLDFSNNEVGDMFHDYKESVGVNWLQAIRTWAMNYDVEQSKGPGFYSDFSKMWSDAIAEDRWVTSKEIESLCDKYYITDATLERMISDFQHYNDTSTVRSLKSWNNRAHWMFQDGQPHPTPPPYD